MNASRAVALTAILAPLAGAFAAGSVVPAGEDAAIRAWIAEARREAKPNMAERLPAAATPPAPAPRDEPPMTADSQTDPFGLAQIQSRQAKERHARRRPAEGDAEEDDDQTATPASAPPPAVRVLGTLLQADTACAVLQIDGASYRVRVGDTLPAQLGRVLQIAQDSVEISSAGTPRLLTFSSTQSRSASTASGVKSGAASDTTSNTTSRRAGKRRLFTPGARG